MADASLRTVPDYAAALLARGRIQLAQKKPVEAVETLTRAARLNPLPEYQWALADALRLAGPHRRGRGPRERSWCERASSPIRARSRSTSPRERQDGAHGGGSRET